MKNILYTILSVLMATTFFSCSPQDNDDNKLGDTGSISVDEINYTKTVSQTSANVFEFNNTTDVKPLYSLLWDFGNGQTSKYDKATTQYPYAGEYTVTLSLYLASGVVVTKSEVLVIAKDDYTLINTPAYSKLTGGANKPEGKTWVIDQYNNYAKEVADATGYDVKGHMGLGAAGKYNQEYWAAGVSAKLPWTIYTSKFHFVQVGTKLTISNGGGVGYGRLASAASVGGFTVTGTEGDDAIFTYAGGEYSFSIVESAKTSVLTLSGNAFLGYYCGTQSYEIFYQTEDVFAVRISNTKEGHDWIMVYCREELNIGKRPKEAPLKEDFEGEILAVAFTANSLGAKSAVVDNPTPYGPNNTSAKVYRYEKSDSKTGDLSYIAPDYKFDLKDQNKVKLKVYIPSYNTMGTLLPKLVVKMQNSEAGDPASTETVKELTIATTEFNKWIDVVLDFSSAAAIIDYDKIAIEFGGSGHTAKGIFYFDDFEFVK